MEMGIVRWVLMKIKAQNMYERKHITKKEWNKIKKEPIFVTDKPKYWTKHSEVYYDTWNDIYPVTSYEAKKKAPKATKEFFDVVKAYPKVVTEIQKTKPKVLILSSNPTSEEEGGWTCEERVFVRPSKSEDKFSKTEVEQWLQRNVPVQERFTERKYLIERVPFSDDEERTIARKRKKSIAEHIFHELQHVEQERELGDDEMLRQSEKYTYWDTPFEREARLMTEKKLMRCSLLDANQNGIIDSFEWRK
jgi:hypothetical protein